MRHQVAGRRLGRASGHRQSLYRNLVTELLKHEKITTTEAKAREIRSMTEKMITLGKRKELHAYRQAIAFITDKDTVEKLFAVLGPRYQQRPGGYTRMTKLGNRLGDGAPVAKLELVQ